MALKAIVNGGIFVVVADSIYQVVNENDSSVCSTTMTVEGTSKLLDDIGKTCVMVGEFSGACKCSVSRVTANNECKLVLGSGNQKKTATADSYAVAWPMERVYIYIYIYIFSARGKIRCY